jgi:putative Ca2+/H+ antiporter (TMEM165/GDT1 family)
MNSSEQIGLVAATFASVFLAELGDKTQLATMLMSANATPASRFYVFVGAALALTLTSAIGAWAGSFITRFVSPMIIHRAAGVLFVVLGAYMLLKRPE